MAQPGTLGSTTGLYLHWRGGLKQTEYQHCRLFKWGGWQEERKCGKELARRRESGEWRAGGRDGEGEHTRLWKNGGNAE